MTVHDVGDLPFTGERVVPRAMHHDPRDVQAHVARYLFSLPYVVDKAVLDAPCGEGYGSYILSWMASHVYGIDRDADTIAHAGRTYQAHHLSFLQRDLMGDVPMPCTFDVIICFEGLEHLSKPEIAVAHFHRLLNPGGLLIASAPWNSGSKWHVRDYTRQDLYDLLATSFDMTGARGYTQGPRLEIMEQEEPLWEHPTWIWVVQR